MKAIIVIWLVFNSFLLAHSNNEPRLSNFSELSNIEASLSAYLDPLVSENSILRIEWDSIDGKNYNLWQSNNLINWSRIENSTNVYTFNTNTDFCKFFKLLPLIESVGADMPYVRYEADMAALGGSAYIESVTNFDQSKIASEASEQIYVSLPTPGAFAEWVIQDDQGGNGVTMRYTMPDSDDGNGLFGTLDVYVNDELINSQPISSYYCYQYFNIGSGHPHDTPGIGEPYFRFDEVHFILPKKLIAGDILRIQKNTNDDFIYGIDFIEIEEVPDPRPKPNNAICVTDFGAVANDDQDDLNAFNLAIIEATTLERTLFIPSGTFNLNNIWSIGSVGNLVNDIHITGAGMWHTNIQFTNPNKASGGISLRVEGKLEFSHVYLNSNLRTRYNEQAIYKGFMDNFGKNSYIHNVWVEHFECGFWVGDYSHSPAIWADGLVIENSRIRNNLADGVNFAQGTKNSTVRNCNVRNNGDDGLAIWTSDFNSAPMGINNTFESNTIENQWRAAAIAFFGGSGHKANNNLIIDGIGSSGFRMNTTFPGYHFNENSDILFEDNVIIRQGTSKDSWGGELGAIDLQASTGPIRNLTISNVEIYDSQRNAIQMGYNGGFNSVEFNNLYIKSTGLDEKIQSKFSFPHLGAAIFTYGQGSAIFNNLITKDIAHSNTYHNQGGFNLIFNNP